MATTTKEKHFIKVMERVKEKLKDDPELFSEMLRECWDATHDGTLGGVAQGFVFALRDSEESLERAKSVLEYFEQAIHENTNEGWSEFLVSQRDVVRDYIAKKDQEAAV